MNQATQQPSIQATPLRGWVSTFHVNYKGNKLGPYYSRTWKVGGKIKREYIKPRDLERVRAACAAYKERRKRESINTRNLSYMIGNLSFITRLCKRLRTGQVTEADLHFVAELNEKGYEIPGRPLLRNNRQSAIKNRQSPDFMYPSTTKSKSALRKVTQMLKKPIFDRYEKETEDEKWYRWIRTFKSRPRAPDNVRRGLSEGITRERIESDVAYLAKLLFPNSRATTNPAASAPRPPTPDSPLESPTLTKNRDLK